MGKKKKNKDDDDVSAPSSIFTSLFGGVADGSAAVSSIFSDNNPFKRKNHESQSGTETAKNPGNADSSHSDVSELKKKRKNKGEKQSLDSNSAEEGATETLLVNEKSRQPVTENPNLGLESASVLNDQEVKNPDVGSEKKRRKKRKRDEVEREYEEKKYGVVVEEEEGKKQVIGKVVVGEKRKKAENDTEEMIVSSKDEGFDDENKLLRTVFVGNLPLKVKKKAVLKEFSKFGEIDSVRIRSVPILETKTPRKGAILQKQINDDADSVHAYIVFKSEQSAEAALAHNMVVVGGNHIRVDRACPPRKKLKGESPLYDNKRTVFVGNLPFDVKDEEIYQLFCGLNNLESSVEAVRVVRHPHMRVGKGIAYVLFKTREAVNLVVKKRNLKLRDRELRLSHSNAGQNSTPSKRKNISPASAVNSPSKKFAADSRTTGSSSKSNSKTPMSYQGLRASKSGTQKKVHLGSTGPVKMKKSKSHRGDKSKVRQDKRPAVALRKARANTMKDGGAPKQAGAKRKMDSRTPQSSQRNKKAKRF